MSSHPKKKRVKKNRMTRFVISELSAVDNPAQEGARVAIMKRVDPDNIDGEGGDLGKAILSVRDDESRRDFVSRFMSDALMRKQFPELDKRLGAAGRQFRLKKDEGELGKGDRLPVLTSSVDGHTHIVWLSGESGGTTTWQKSPDSESGHDHPWVIGTDGSLVIGDNDGHSHIISPDAVVAAMRALFVVEEDTTEAIAAVVFAQHADGPPVDPRDIEPHKLADLVVKSWLADEFPIRCLSDLRNAIDAWDHAECQDQVARYISKRARALELDHELPSDGGLADAIAKTAGPVGGGVQKGSGMTTKPKPADKTGEGDSTAELEKLRAELEVSKAFGQLSDAQREYHKKLGKDDAAAFLKMPSEDRDAELAKAKAKIDVIYKSADGTKYTSADDPRLVSSAKTADETAKQLALMKAASNNAEYTKRAGKELSNLPGDDQVKVALLKAIDTIDDEEVRKGALAIIKVGNDKLAKAFEKIGTRAGMDSAPSDRHEADEKLNALAKAYQGEHPDVEFFDAYEIVGGAHPELLAQAVGS